MKFTKRILAILLAGIMLFSFVSCGDSKEEGGVVTLKWLVPGEQQPDTPKVLEAINKITEKEIGVKLDLQYITTSSYNEKMKMNMASGGDFDICFTSTWTNKYKEAVKSGGLYDISNLVDKELKAVMPEHVWDGAKVGGKLYAVPNYQMMFKQVAVMFRTDLLEKYDFDVETVKHIEDIEPFLKTIKENEPGVFPYNASRVAEPWLVDRNVYGIASDVSYDADNKKFVNTRESKEYERAVKVLRDWYKKGYIRSDFAASGRDTNPTDINQGKYAVRIDAWKPGIEELQTGIHYTYHPIAEPVATAPTAALTGISATCKHPEKAMELIKLMNTNKEVYTLICYGIEGVHYDLNEEGKIVLKENSGYVPQGDWLFGNQFNAPLSEGMADDTWELTEKLNTEAKVPPTLGFDPDTTNISIEQAQITATISEYDDFITVPDYEDFKAKRKKAMLASGYEKVFNELKKQFTEYLKNK